MTADKLAECITSGMFLQYDALLIQEWGSSVEPSIPGFQLFGAQPTATRAARRGGGRGTGLYTFIRTARARLCSKVEQTETSVWVRVRSTAANQADDWYIGNVYMPPEGSTFWHNQRTYMGELERLRASILRFQARGSVAAFGDFNARAASFPDVPTGADTLLEGVGADALAIRQFGVPPTRRSRDSGTGDTRGKQLVEEVCWATSCVILNGRAPGDRHGQWTRDTTRNGQPSRSCIDYGLVEACAYSRVQQFSIRPHMQLSDHNMMVCDLQLAPAAAGAPRPQAPPQPRWDDDKQTEYAAALQHPVVQQQLANLPQLPLAEHLADLESILYKTALEVFGAEQPQPRDRQAGRARPKWLRGDAHRTWIDLQAAVQRGNPEEMRRARNVFNAQKRRMQRQLRARGQDFLLRGLRHNPKQFWAKYKAAQRTAAGVTLDEATQHYSSSLGGAGRGALEEQGARTPAQLTAQLEAASPRRRLSAEQMAAAQRLNAPIDGGEVLTCMLRLHTQASPGLGSLGAAFFKGAWRWVESGDGKRTKEYLLVDTLTTGLNRIFQSDYPEVWNLQPLSSVYKGKGDGGASNLDNHRPIQCQRVLQKLYHSILQHRLDAFAEQFGLRAEGQAAFRTGRRTSDNVFVMRHLIDRARFRGGYLFACFVDFRKAYDSIWRSALMRVLAAAGIHGNMLRTIVGMYWGVRACVKQGGELGPEFHSTCGVRQGDPLSPLLFGLFIDRFESYLASYAPSTGVMLNGRRLRMLLYADDMVLLASNAQGLQDQLNVLRCFCSANHLEVNVQKTEIVVFGPRKWCPPRPFRWLYHGQQIRRSDSFKYLGAVMHQTKGLNLAVDCLKAAGMRALWGMQARCKRRGIVDFSMLCRLYRILAQPILNYCSEVWAPGLMHDLDKALHAPLQVVQNDFVRFLGGLRSRVPVDVLAKESGLQPISRMWLAACCKLWNRVVAARGGLLRDAFLDNLELAQSMASERTPTCTKVWCGAWITTMHWLAAMGDETVRDCVSIMEDVIAGDSAAALLRPVATDAALKAFDRALSTYTSDRAKRSPVSAAVVGEYMQCYAIRPDDQVEEDGFPADMPYYFKHTSRFNTHAHARTLMRVRCVSYPLAACPTSFTSDKRCTHCHNSGAAPAPQETIEHVVFDCPGYAGIRDSARFAPLFQPFQPELPPSPDRMRRFINQANQHRVASFLHLCFDKHTQNL